MNHVYMKEITDAKGFGLSELQQRVCIDKYTNIYIHNMKGKQSCMLS